MSERLNTDKIGVLTRALERERKARVIAEELIEKRLQELYNSNIVLNKTVLNEKEYQKEIIENLVDAFFVIDFHGNIIDINVEGYKLIGADNTGKPKNINEFNQINKKKLFDLFSKKRYRDKEVLFSDFINRDGDRKYISIKSKRLYDSENKAYAYQAIVRDVTKETLADIILKRKQRIKNFEVLVLAELIKNPDITDNAWTIVKHISNFLGTKDCVFYAVVNDELVQMANTSGINYNDQNRFKVKIGEGIVGQVAESRMGIICPDTRLSKNYIAEGEKRLSEIAVPVVLDDELIGVIDAEHLDKNYFTQEHLEVLSQISTIVSLYLKNSIIDLEKTIHQVKLEETQNRLQIIFESSSDAKVIESMDGLIDQVSHAFVNLFNIPVENISDIIGLKCTEAREMLKQFFVEESSFAFGIQEIVDKGEVVIDEILELKDGRILSRDYNPIKKNGEPIAHIWTYKDVTLILNYDKSLKFQNKKYKRIIENMNMGLMEVDNNDVILNVNNAFVNMCGFKEEELLGHRAEDILFGEDDQNPMRDVFETRRERAKLYEVEIINKNKEARYWMNSSTPNNDITGKVIGNIGIHLDVTAMRNLTSKAEELNVDLFASNEELAHYAHIVSHELKTPLRTISICVNWLLEDLEDHLTKDTRAYIESIEESIKDMDKQITSTLQFSEIRTSNIKEGPFVLQDTVDTIISNINKEADDGFKIIINTPLPNININQIKAKQIFENLLENAYKYRDLDKKCVVQIDWKEDNKFFVFSIKDNGIGIEDKHKDLVFEAYKKLNNRADSSGLGLFIVKKIITFAGGDIWVESKVGVGTTFNFTILK
ncbi:PAS domain S-box protein [Ulvibacter sp.]|nr:PAS domain S-box protein [Ulvibacter sp.]